MNNILLNSSDEFLKRFSENFGESRSSGTFWIILLVALGVLLTVMFIKRVVRENFIDREGRHVFNELCRAHDLSRKERLLLRGYAQNLGLRNRAVVFVRPSLFDEAARRTAGEEGIAGKLNLNLDALDALDAGLRTKLFGDYHLNGTLHRQADKMYQGQAQ